MTHWQADRQTGRQADTLIDRQTDRRADTLAGRQIGSETEKFST